MNDQIKGKQLGKKGGDKMKRARKKQKREEIAPYGPEYNLPIVIYSGQEKQEQEQEQEQEIVLSFHNHLV
jgi:hypothetical protein